jgi:hypothetical protein
MAYRPNQVPLKDRVLCCVLSVVLVAYGTYGLMSDGLNVRRGVTLYGFPKLLMIGAMFGASLAMLITVIDHYDRRDNERYYRIASRIVQGFAWTCFALSLVLDTVIK